MNRRQFMASAAAVAFAPALSASPQRIVPVIGDSVTMGFNDITYDGSLSINAVRNAQRRFANKIKMYSPNATVLLGDIEIND